MFADSDQQEIKIIDFGRSGEIERYNSKPGYYVLDYASTETSAPEVLRASDKYSDKENYPPITGAADVYSLAVMTYIMLSGSHPFLEENIKYMDSDTVYKIRDNRAGYISLNSRRTVSGAIPADVDLFLQRSLNWDPTLRPSAAEFAQFFHDLQI